jgi:hypothetical protein
MMECPHNHGSMTLQKRPKTITLGCNIWHFDADFYVCPVCDLEIEPDKEVKKKLPTLSSASRKAVSD